MSTASTLRSVSLPSDASFEAVRDEYFAIRDEWKELLREYDARHIARNLSPADVNNTRTAVAAASVEKYLLPAQNKRRFAAEINVLHDRIEDLRPVRDAAKERYDLAASEEAGRIARSMAPRHRAAVVEIDAALEALQKALAKEIAVRAEFESASPTPWPSQLLPNMSATFLKTAWLPNYDSKASCWRREARSFGLIP